MTQTTVAAIIEGPSLFLKARFQTYDVFGYLLHKNDMLIHSDLVYPDHFIFVK